MMYGSSAVPFPLHQRFRDAIILQSWLGFRSSIRIGISDYHIDNEI